MNGTKQPSLYKTLGQIYQEDRERNRKMGLSYENFKLRVEKLRVEERSVEKITTEVIEPGQPPPPSIFDGIKTWIKNLSQTPQPGEPSCFF